MYLDVRIIYPLLSARKEGDILRGMSRLHENEVDISLQMVRGLLDEQFPQYEQLELAPMGASGSSNLQFRLGDELLPYVCH